MKKACTHSIAAIVILSAALIAQAASDVVLIDHGDPAYTVYAGLPNDRAEDVKSKIANQPAQLVSFSEFSEGRAKFITDRIVSDEYAGSHAAEGIVELVRKYPGTPFGITWNGGIAFTRNDYQFAKLQFGIFNKDPDKYKQTRKPDPLSDPINPMSHLHPMLGW